MGTSVVEAFGRDFTGRYLHEALEGFERSYTYTHRVEVAESGLPSYRHGYGTLPFKLDFAPIERVYLPFAADGARVDVILGMTVYLARPQGRRLTHAGSAASRHARTAGKRGGPCYRDGSTPSVHPGGRTWTRRG